MSDSIGVLSATIVQLAMVYAMLPALKMNACLPAGHSGEVESTQSAMELIQAAGKKMRTLIVFTSFACTDDDASALRLGDVVIMGGSNLSPELKGAVLRCAGSQVSTKKATAFVAETITFRPADWYEPVHEADYRQAGGDRKDPVVHWMPFGEQKLVADLNNTGDLGKALRFPVLYIGAIVDYRTKYASYGNAFNKWGAVIAGSLIVTFMHALDLPAIQDASWPPVTSTPTTIESKSDFKEVASSREQAVSKAKAVREQAVADAKAARELRFRRQAHTDKLAGCKRKIETLGNELEQAVNKVRKLEQTLLESRELLGKLEAEQIV